MILDVKVSQGLDTTTVVDFLAHLYAIVSRS
jgi:hypothetical protein